MSNDNTVATIANTTSTAGGKWVARYEERRNFIESKEKTSTGNTKRLPVKHRKIILEHTAGDRPAIEFGVTKTQYGRSIRDHRPMTKEVNKKIWERDVVYFPGYVFWDLVGDVVATVPSDVVIDSFCIGSAEDGNCGDSYDSYAEMSAALTTLV